MSVRRLAGIPGFAIDEVAARAGTDPHVLRLENLDTDVPPPAAAVAATRAAVGTDEANSYLPFTGTSTSAPPWQPSNGRPGGRTIRITRS